ncbi:MAG: replicative DNA helicase [Desulfobaccales bacterium]
MAAPFTSAEPIASKAAEQALLGSVFLCPAALDDLVGWIGPSDFYWNSHSQILQAMLAVRQSGNPADSVTVVDWLHEHGLLDKVGGAAYLSNMAEATGFASHVSTYAHKVKEKAVVRNLVVKLQQSLQACHQPVDKVTDLLDFVESQVFEVTESLHESRLESWLLADLAVHEELRIRRIREIGGFLGIPSGFQDLDRLTMGFHSGDSIIIAARPAMGKTALGLNLGYRVAQTGVPVAFISLEMSKEQLTQRLLACISRINLNHLRSGDLSQEEEQKLQAAIKASESLPLHLIEKPHLTPMEVRSISRRMYAKGVRLVVVDYLQLLHVPGEKFREQEIAAISRSLKGIARELNIPVITLAQLNRQVESRDDKRPRLSDLRESGAIEQDADLILCVYRDEIYRQNSPKKGLAEVLIRKHRNGPTGNLDLVFMPEICRFEDYLINN